MMPSDCETEYSIVNQTLAIHHGKASEMLACRVREHTKTSLTIKKKRGKKKKADVLKNVMQEDRKGKGARRTPYVLKRNRYLLHGRNTKKITAVARKKTTRRR